MTASPPRSSARIPRPDRARESSPLDQARARILLILAAPSWTTLGGYFDALEARGISVNVASYAGLGTLLGCVQGDSLARPDRAGLEAMKDLLDEAMRDGAIGLSTMLASPRELAVTTDDIVELAAVVRRRGGLYSSHIRNEGTEVFAAVKEAIDVGRRAGVPVDIIHLKIADQSLWHRMGEIVALIEQARREGVNVQANVYPYTRGNNDLVTIIPPWAHEGGKAALIPRLKDPALRDRLKREIRSGLPGWYDHYTAVGGDWGRMLISARLTTANHAFEGQTMDQVIAVRSAGIKPAPDPLDVFFDFLIAEGGSVGTIYAHHTEEDMNLAMAQPWCSIGSDGSALAIEGPLRAGHPHPRSFGTFARVLGEYVRNRRLLRLEDAVRKMTSLSAAKAGIVDRGILRPGLFADVTIFEPDTVVDRATYLDPFRYSVGIRYVLVNGQLVLDGGQHTHAHPGRSPSAWPMRSDACASSGGTHDRWKAREESRLSLRYSLRLPTDLRNVWLRCDWSWRSGVPKKKTGQRLGSARGPLPSPYEIRSTGRLEAALGPSRRGRGHLS